MAQRDPLKSYRFGVALGSGSARGWAHIGVLQALHRLGIIPEVVAGASIGALVGAAYASHRMDELESWVSGLRRLDVIRMLDISITGGGLLQGRRVLNVFGEKVENARIEELHPSFTAVATDLHNGREVWISKGPILDAVRASISLPGLFTPTKLHGRWLVDGGLVNPVPVSVCRAMGADIVIAVNLNGDMFERIGSRFVEDSDEPENTTEATEPNEAEEDDVRGLRNSVMRWNVKDVVSFFREQETRRDQVETAPGLFDVTAASINIMQDRITRSRMAGDPAEIVISPRLSHIGLMEFHRAKEAVREGAEAVNRMQSSIEHLLDVHLTARDNDT
ncbi:MAG: patatin-like phospholipase RssA [Pseudomonadota bacterium]|nr:patatin-like phospholipase RssA [Pseudomonadota bacterium]